MKKLLSIMLVLLLAWLFHVPEVPFVETPEDFGGDVCFIVRDHETEEGKIEYYTLNAKRHKVAEIPPFENEAEIYLSHYDNFSCSIEDGKVTNRLLDTKLTDLDGNPIDNIENRDIINRITKELYPGIARKFDTSASKVERAMRHAIEVAWSRGRLDTVNRMYGYKVFDAMDKPTNGEYISCVSELIKRRRNAV